VTACPDLGTLEIAPLPAEARAHVESCEACRLVIDLIGAGSVDDCERFDGLLAAHTDGTLGEAGANLLARHLASCAACRAVAETLSPGADAGGDLATLPNVDPTSYALGLEVARGGMGRILAARDLRVGRPVAVKELLGTSPQLAARFEREARVTARLQHPGIVPIYEIGRWPDGTPFYAMRMVDGHTLREAIEAAPTLAARIALLPPVLAAAEAIAFAHGQRVIHRDLTPSNILVGAYGETVVIDWGLAKDLSAGLSDDEDGEPDRAAHSAANLTGVGAVIGTAAYMPPEQAHAVPVDERADVYALGAILYHLLAGEPPYRAPTTREVLRAVKTGPPRPVEQLAPHAPRDLVSIVTKAMARDPNDRYPTARELTEELKRFQTGRMVEAHAYSQAERVVRFARRHRGALVVTALATIVLGVFGAAAVSRVLRSGAEARAQVTTLLEERGRMELLAGNPLRALAYLDAAHDRSADTASLRFLIANAIREIDAFERDLECGGEVGTFSLSPDGTRLAAACQTDAKVWQLSDGTPIATLGPVPAAVGAFDEVLYSHDGHTLATWGTDHKARLWNAKTGSLLATFDHGASLTFVSFTPDDRRIATTGHDGNARIWSTDGTLLRTIAANTSVLRHVYGVLSPLKSQLLTLTMLGEGRGWNIDTGELLGGFEHGGLVLGGELSTDGLRAATCGADRLVKVWNATTGEHLRTLGGHTDVVWKCVFSSDSKRLLSTGHDGRATVWDLATGAQVASVIHGDVLTAARFSPDGKRFATIGVGGRVVVWETASGAQLASHDLHGGTDALFSLDGTQLISARGDGRIRIWNHAAGPLLASYAADDRSRVVAVTGDGSRVAVETHDHITLVDPRDRRVIAHEPISAPIAVAGAVVAAVADGAVVVLDATTGTTRMRHSLTTRPRSLALGADCVAVASEAGTDVISLAGGAPARLGPAQHVVLSERCDLALLWSGAEPPVVWDVAARRPLATLRPDGSRAYAVLGFASAARIVLVEDTEPPEVVDGVRAVSVWNARTGARVAELPGTRLPPTLDPSRRWVTTIGTDHVVTVWNVENGRPRSAFVGQSLLQAQTDPSGALIVGIAAYGTEALVMNASDGRVLARWPIEHGPPMLSESAFRPVASSAAWSTDGTSILTRSSTFARWQVSSSYEPARLASIVRDHLPWTVDGGRLAWIESRLRGRVVRGGIPVAGAAVVAEIRRPPDLEGGSFSNESTRGRIRHTTVTTDDDGEFELAELFPGQYTLRASLGPLAAMPVEVPVRSETANVELELPAR